MKKPRMRAILKAKGYKRSTDICGFRVYTKKGHPAFLPTTYSLKVMRLLNGLNPNPNEVDKKHFEKWFSNYDFVAKRSRTEPAVVAYRRGLRKRNQ
ncbi:hypothetical protein [Bacillus phage phiAGATE]|uniref:Uncharacterized protein n=1 Tax=Bacillus phage phiAGATE TaxID=1204533 RepID=L0LC45_9CAUD|nr:hypothetical protein G380_gp110 [Bacillus phage phiAGATE]AGB62760.1 hypothetical protein [Bacillus phage phiAGATE]